MLPPQVDAQKVAQSRYFDSEGDPEFEIERPHGTPWLYRWYYEEKFRRSVMSLRHILAGATALTVCGGSGMDAEFLTATGSRVICSDVSVGACRRALERADRHGFEMSVVVADAEHLPFADASIDVVYVHDGLHHLAQPLLALYEMARVARRAVSVTEPARATVTNLAVRLGLALEVEDAGNRVARFEVEEIRRPLEAAGFKTVHAERYAMYYKHEPGRVLRALSWPGIRSVMRVGIESFNAVAGRIGNRLTLQAIREA